MTLLYGNSKDIKIIKTMYVIKSGKLVTDEVMEAFKVAWKWYERCNCDDSLFINLLVSSNKPIDEALEFLALLKNAKDII